MKRRLLIYPRADQDLDEIFEYIAEDNIDAALRVVEQARNTFDELLVHPFLGRRWESDSPRLKDIRLLQVRGFRNYLVFYKATEQTVEIVRVLHGARQLKIALKEE